MAQRTDPARLASELVAAGVPQSSFTGCRSGGPLPTIAWAPGHPTPAEDATAQAVLAAHDPDVEEKENAERGGSPMHLACVKRAADYAMIRKDAVVIGHGGATITLPPASMKGKVVTIKKKDPTGTPLTVAARSGDDIEGKATLKLPVQYATATLIADGAHTWYRMGSV